MPFLGGEALAVGGRQRATARNRPPKGIILVGGTDSVVGVQQAGHIPSPIRVVEGVGVGDAVDPAVGGAAEQSAYPAGSLPPAAQVQAPGVGHLGRVRDVAFLHHSHAVLQVHRRTGQRPASRHPRVLPVYRLLCFSLTASSRVHLFGREPSNLTGGTSTHEHTHFTCARLALSEDWVTACPYLP